MNIEPAVFSDCRRYRYRLGRQWRAEPKRLVAFVMLNPSVADDVQNDPTITRCIGFAKTWGFDGLLIGNAYAWRSTDPRALLTAEDAIGEDNNLHLAEIANRAELIVCGWGTHCDIVRGREVLDVLHNYCDQVKCFVQNKNGSPKHPLYVRGDALPIEYRL